MKNKFFNLDFLKILFSIFFITIMGITSYWIIKPFILSFIWASIIVITTWPLIRKLQCFFWNIRILAIIIVIIMLILLFIIPFILLVNNLIENSISGVQWILSEYSNWLNFSWLNDVPIIGKKIYTIYYNILKNSNINIISKIQPYIKQTTDFVFSQAGYFGRFMIHLILMLIFSIFLYFNGEKINRGIHHFVYKISGHQGNVIIFLTYQAIRSVVCGIVISTLIQSMLSFLGLIIFGVPHIQIISMLVVFFCLLQVGPLPILILSSIWLYLFNSSSSGILFFLWSCIIGILDNILKPVLIKIGSNIPKSLILLGILGGIFSFGMLGLFLGPVILAISYRLIYVWMYDIPLYKKKYKKLIFK